MKNSVALMTVGLLFVLAHGDAHASINGRACNIDGTADLYRVYNQCDSLITMEVEAEAVRQASAMSLSRAKGAVPPRTNARVSVKKILWGSPATLHEVLAHPYQVLALAGGSAIACVKSEEGKWEVLTVYRITPTNGPCPMSFYEDWARYRAALLSARTPAETSNALMAMWRSLSRLEKRNFLSDIEEPGRSLDYDVIAEALVGAANSGKFELAHLRHSLRSIFMGGRAGHNACKYVGHYLRMLESPRDDVACLAEDELRAVFGMSEARMWPHRCPLSRRDPSQVSREWRQVVAARKDRLGGCSL